MTGQINWDQIKMKQMLCAVQKNKRRDKKLADLLHVFKFVEQNSQDNTTTLGRCREPMDAGGAILGHLTLTHGPVECAPWTRLNVKALSNQAILGRVHGHSCQVLSHGPSCRPGKERQPQPVYKDGLQYRARMQYRSGAISRCINRAASMALSTSAFPTGCIPI